MDSHLEGHLHAIFIVGLCLGFNTKLCPKVIIDHCVYVNQRSTCLQIYGKLIMTYRKEVILDFGIVQNLLLAMCFGISSDDMGHLETNLS